MVTSAVTLPLSHLDRLEPEAVHILREAVSECRHPVMLFSAGEDSTVLPHVALRAFYPGKRPFPLLHIDSTWEVQSLLAPSGMNPFDHGDAYTTLTRNLGAVVQETLTASASERQGRVSDGDSGGSLEHQKRQGYF